MELYSKQDHNSCIRKFPYKFGTFQARGRVRRPQRLSSGTVTLTQYPERYVVQRESSRNFRRRLEDAADLAIAPKMLPNFLILDDLPPVAFPLKTLSKSDPGKKWLA